MKLPIINNETDLSSIPFHYFDSTCSICDKTFGAKLPCDAAGCKNYLHATCAYDIGFCEIDSTVAPDPLLNQFVFCKFHSNREPRKSKFIKSLPKPIEKIEFDQTSVDPRVFINAQLSKWIDDSLEEFRASVALYYSNHARKSLLTLQIKHCKTNMLGFKTVDSNAENQGQSILSSFHKLIKNVINISSLFQNDTRKSGLEGLLSTPLQPVNQTAAHLFSRVYHRFFEFNENLTCKRLICSKCNFVLADIQDELVRMVICDKCNEAHHLKCLDPPLTRVPEKGTVFRCAKCDTARLEFD